MDLPKGATGPIGPIREVIGPIRSNCFSRGVPREYLRIPIATCLWGREGGPDPDTSLALLWPVSSFCLLIFLAYISNNVDPGLIGFASDIKSSIKSICIYAADVKSRQHF